MNRANLERKYKTVAFLLLEGDANRLKRELARYESPKTWTREIQIAESVNSRDSNRWNHKLAILKSPKAWTRKTQIAENVNSRGTNYRKRELARLKSPKMWTREILFRIAKSVDSRARALRGVWKWQPVRRKNLKYKNMEKSKPPTFEKVQWYLKWKLSWELLRKQNIEKITSQALSLSLEGYGHVFESSRFHLRLKEQRYALSYSHVSRSSSTCMPNLGIPFFADEPHLEFHQRFITS